MWGGGDNPSYDEDGDFDVGQAEVLQDAHPVPGVVVNNIININVNVSGSLGVVRNVSVNPHDKEAAANVGENTVQIEEEINKPNRRGVWRWSLRGYWSGYRRSNHNYSYRYIPDI